MINAESIYALNVFKPFHTIGNVGKLRSEVLLQQEKM